MNFELYMSNSNQYKTTLDAFLEKEICVYTKRLDRRRRRKKTRFAAYDFHLGKKKNKKNVMLCYV
jgi:hypothetical protein